MSSAKNIFNSKIDISSLTGSHSFFNNVEEAIENNIKQERFISSLDYSDPKNFAKFGSAEEYYKNSINYITEEYKFDSCTEQKLNWVNYLNDFEYYLFSKEFPRAYGSISLSGTQYIEIYSHVKDIEKDAKESYEDTVKRLSNRILDFSSGFTFEGWMSFEEDTTNTNILQIQAITGSSGILSTKNLVSIIRDVSSTPRIAIKDEISSVKHYFSTEIAQEKWQHYAVYVKNNSASLYINGQLTENITYAPLDAAQDTYVFGPYGLMYNSVASTSPSVIGFTQKYVFKVGSAQKFSLDELRFWNGERSLEKIGRYWFTNVDGNDFSDSLNSKLIFYYKFNEGWDILPDLCLDYSGYQNISAIKYFSNDCRNSESGINLSGLVEDLEKKDIIINGLAYSTAVKNFYETKISSGALHDEQNLHILYNKFPGWILEQEEDNSPKHLKQLIHIISAYFDDLYAKISEMNKYKHIQYSTDKNNIYPFYDKILTSAGFDVTDLFSNVDILEKLASRNDVSLFDEDIKKIKNAVYQNIYNNISYIFKSKGTAKSLKSFLKSYGIDENLIKINLYADKTEFNGINRAKTQTVKKKSVTTTGNKNIYLNSLDAFYENSDNKFYSLETSLSFPSLLAQSCPVTSSIFGFHNSTLSFDLSQTDFSTNYFYNVTLEYSASYGHRIVFSDGTNIVKSQFYSNFYDDSIWNFCIRKKPNIDILSGSSGVTLTYNLELYAVNNNRSIPLEYSCSLPYVPQNGYLRHYIGAFNEPYDTNNNIHQANCKFYYCNFWTDYLNNDVIKSHNEDILNYGINE